MRFRDPSEAQRTAEVRGLLEGEGRLGQVVQGVDDLPVEVHLEVQVIAGGVSGQADVADDLPLLHVLTLGDGKGAEMGVRGLEAVAVVDHDVEPV